MPDSIVYTPTARNAVRVLKSTSDTLTVGGHLVVFDDPDAPQKDLAGDYFTRDTDFGPARELKTTGQLFHHGMPLKDGTVFDGPLPLLKITEDEIGLFVETTYEMANEYHRAVGTAVKNSIEKGAPFGWSSSTALQTYKRADDGRLLKWWLIEGSPTPTPCEPRTVAGTKLLGKAVPLSHLAGGSGTILKAESLSARIERVYRAFYDEMDGRGWVAEVFADHVVAEIGNAFYRIAYDDDGEAVRFADAPTWEKVERVVSYEPMKAVYDALVAKASPTDFDPELLALSLRLHNSNTATRLRA